MRQYFATEALDRWLQHSMLDVHTSIPCKVLAYDASKQTVDVRPQVKRYLVSDDDTRTAEELPDLYDVPVAFPRAGGFHISLPIAADDYVLVLCTEEPTIAWRDKARVVEPGILDRHGLNGCFAIPCGFPDKEKLGTAPPTDAVVVSKDDGSGSVTVKAGEVLLGDNTATNYVALANLVNDEFDRVKIDIDNLITGIGTALNAITTAGGGPAVVSAFNTAVNTTNPTPTDPDSVDATKTKAK